MIEEPYHYTCVSCGNVWATLDHVSDVPAAGICDECGEEENVPDEEREDADA